MNFVLTNNKKIIAFFILLLGIVFIPYVISGGFIMDDWWVLHASFISKNLTQNFLYWVRGALAYRPLSALNSVVTGRLIGDNTVVYIIYNLTFWFGFLIVTTFILKKYFGQIFSYFFFLFAVAPAIASTTIILNVTTLTLFLWSVSLYLLDYHLKTQKSWSYWLSYLLIIIALLIYETIFPLLLITAFFPVAVRADWHTLKFNNKIKVNIRHVSPVIIIVSLIFIFQNFIVPLYARPYSRLRSRTVIEMIMSFFDWFIAVFISGPITIFSSVFHYGFDIFFQWKIILLLLLILLLCYFIFIEMKSKNIKLNLVGNKSLILLFAVTLFACSLLLILSGFAASVSGYENRMLSTSWILLSVFLALISVKLLNSKLYFIPPLLLFLTYLSFTIQINNYIDSWKLQNKILNNCQTLIESNGVNKGSSIIANVPKYLSQNYNNEQVFCAWEFNDALEIKTNKTIIGGSAFRINSQLKMDSTFIRSSNNTLYLFGYWEWYSVPVNDSLYYYRYDQINGSSELIKVKNIQHIVNLIKSDGLTDINKVPVPISRLMQEKLIYFAANAKFIPMPERIRKFLMRIYNTHQLQR